MKRYQLTPAAETDLEEIFDHIRVDSTGAALRVLKRVRDAMRRLAEYPRMGHVREDLVDKSLRFWPVYSYLIVYRPNSRPLQIIRMLHGARNVQRILRSE